MCIVGAVVGHCGLVPPGRKMATANGHDNDNEQEQDDSSTSHYVIPVGQNGWYWQRIYCWLTLAWWGSPWWRNIQTVKHATLLLGSNANTLMPWNMLYWLFWHKLHAPSFTVQNHHERNSFQQRNSCWGICIRFAEACTVKQWEWMQCCYVACFLIGTWVRLQACCK